jgi:hypothetical protein
MAGNRLVNRVRAAAERSEAPGSTEDRQHSYREELARDIGPTTFGRPMTDPEDDPALTRPVTIFLLALLTFTVTLGVLLWREGVFDGLVPAQGAEVPVDRQGWILGRKAGAAPEDLTPVRDPEEVQANASAPHAETTPATVPLDEEPAEETEDETP